jgi:hypothetical protein
MKAAALALALMTTFTISKKAFADDDHYKCVPPSSIICSLSIMGPLSPNSFDIALSTTVQEDIEIFRSPYFANTKMTNEFILSTDTYKKARAVAEQMRLHGVCVFITDEVADQ